MLVIIFFIVLLFIIPFFSFIYKVYKLQREYLEETGEKISVLKIIEYYMVQQYEDYLIEKNEPGYIEKKTIKDIFGVKSNK